MCVWQYCHNLRKVMFYREIYIYKYNTYIYKNVYCMDMHWMFAQNLEERAALNKMTVELVSSAETEERSVKKTFCVKIMCKLQTFFKPWLCDGRVLFLHLFLIVIFYIFTIWWCKCIIPEIPVLLQSFLLTCYVSSFSLVDVKGRLRLIEKNKSPTIMALLLLLKEHNVKKKLNGEKVRLEVFLTNF